MFQAKFCTLLPDRADQDVMSPLPSGLKTTVSVLNGKVAGTFDHSPIGPADMIWSISPFSAAKR